MTLACVRCVSESIRGENARPRCFGLICGRCSIEMGAGIPADRFWFGILSGTAWSLWSLSDRFGKALQGIYAIQALDGFGRFFPCGGEIVFELLIDPVDKFPASDDAAVYEIPSPIPEAVEFIEFEVSFALLL